MSSRGPLDERPSRVRELLQEGSWDEVSRAYHAGLITLQQYTALFNALP
jgi:hypothetical protein